MSGRNSSPRDRRDSHSKYHSRGSDHERSRTREYDRNREQDNGHRRRDQSRSLRDERRRDKGNEYDRHRSRDHDRHRDFNQDRQRRRKQRSPSNSRDTSRNWSRSPSRSPSPPSKSKRMSGFDMAPPVAPGLAEQLPGAPVTASGMLPNMLPYVGTQVQLGGFHLMPAQSMTQQATRHARRVYVGGLPPSANEQTIATYFSHVMAAIGGNSAGPGDAVVNVYINHEKKFAFVEMRTVEEASNAMALDGITFEGVAVRVRRPTDYNPSLAATLGPSHPNPNLNLAAVGLTPGGTAGVEGPDRVFVGGLPYYFTEGQMRELLESFGPLRGFDLVKDKDTGNSKGYGFCVYQDPAVTDIACAALNGLKMGDKVLTVRRATASAQSKSEQDNVLAQAHQHIAIQKMVLQAGGLSLPVAASPAITNSEVPSKVLCLTEVVGAETLRDDQEYQEILEDMQDECSKFGTLVNIVIPRPSIDGEQIPGVGKVFLEYSNTVDSANARISLSGRRFEDNIVCAVYYPEDKYYSSDYGA